MQRFTSRFSSANTRSVVSIFLPFQSRRINGVSATACLIPATVVSPTHQFCEASPMSCISVAALCRSSMCSVAKATARHSFSVGTTTPFSASTGRVFLLSDTLLLAPAPLTCSLVPNTPELALARLPAAVGSPTISMASSCAFDRCKAALTASSASLCSGDNLFHQISSSSESNMVLALFSRVNAASLAFAAGSVIPCAAAYALMLNVRLLNSSLSSWLMPAISKASFVSTISSPMAFRFSINRFITTLSKLSASSQMLPICAAFHFFSTAS